MVLFLFRNDGGDEEEKRRGREKEGKNFVDSRKCSIFAADFKNQSFGSSGCSAVGSALRSGRRGRAFESPHPDQKRIKKGKGGEKGT